MPCFKTAFSLKHEIFGELHMDGNTIFAMSEPTAEEMKRLVKSRPTELVITMGSMTKIHTAEEINQRIDQLKALMGVQGVTQHAVYG
jgi:hypothetical protein